MTPIIHNYSQVAGKTVYWDTSDSESLYLKNIQDSQSYQQLSDLGFLNTQIDYQYNSHGFRTFEFDRKFEVVCFGDSFTMGTGVHAKDTWPAQFSVITGLTVANLGHAGSSNDTAVRMALHYLPLLRPQYAIWVQTDMHRIELIDDSVPLSLNILAGDTSNPCADDEFIKIWFTSDTNQQLQQQKNTLAFRMLCRLENIIPIIIPRGQIPNFDRARDLMHSGRLSYQELAQSIISRLSKVNQE